MKLGVSSSLRHSSPEEWAARHLALGLETVVFPVDHLSGEDTIMAYKHAADEAGLQIAEVGVWRNTLAADPDMPMIIEHLDTDEQYAQSVAYVRRVLMDI